MGQKISGWQFGRLGQSEDGEQTFAITANTLQVAGKWAVYRNRPAILAQGIHHRGGGADQALESFSGRESHINQDGHPAADQVLTLDHYQPTEPGTGPPVNVARGITWAIAAQMIDFIKSALSRFGARRQPSLEAGGEAFAHSADRRQNDDLCRFPG